MATNLALVSLTDNVKRTTADVKRIQKAYDSLQNKSTKYALDHQALLMAYKEVLAVYVRHLKAAQQSFAPDAAPLSAPDDTTGAFDDSIIGSLP